MNIDTKTCKHENTKIYHDGAGWDVVCSRCLTRITQAIQDIRCPKQQNYFIIAQFPSTPTRGTFAVRKMITTLSRRSAKYQATLMYKNTDCIELALVTTDYIIQYMKINNRWKRTLKF